MQPMTKRLIRSMMKLHTEERSDIMLTKTAALVAHQSSLVASGWLASSPYLLNFQHPAAWFVPMLAAVLLLMEYGLPKMPWLGRGILLLLAAILLMFSPFSLGFAREWVALENDWLVALLLCSAAFAMLRHARAEGLWRDRICRPWSIKPPADKDQP
jgi:putative effector of murein hydrolase LrgA (UPF0299 family)